MGYEKDEEMWAAAVIMSQLSGLEMELHLEDGARADPVSYTHLPKA